MKRITDLALGRELVRKGQIIAYPTEAVYGLGCDPFNEEAVHAILRMKQRPVEKGLIVLIAHWDQLPLLIEDIPDKAWEPIKNTWPGPVTWIFPKAKMLPSFVSGEHQTIAVRMTAHPIARELCLEHPLISTSANISGQEPATDFAQLHAQFPTGIDVFVEGSLGQESAPSKIFDVMSQKRLR